MSNIIAIGAGQAGLSVSVKLRKLGFDGTITLVGAEPFAPYQRPALSKAYLLGDMALERMYLRPKNFYSENEINLKLGHPVTKINRDEKKISFGAEVLPYDHLVLTTGSIPRQLPKAVNGGLDGVFVLRTLADVDYLEPLFCQGASLLVVGGGYTGLEIAAVATKSGLSVTLVEAADRILKRVAASETSDYFRTLHTSYGVDIREGISLEMLEGKDGRVKSALLSDASRLDVDFVVVGIGVTPSTDLARTAGLEIDNGIKVNAYCQTSDLSIWAAGDCASFPFRGDRVRLESVPNAIDQAECVAQNIMGADQKYLAKPWFWSDQYDIKLQITGLNTGYDRVITRPGIGPSTSHWYYRGAELLAVDAMNSPRAYMVGKQLIDRGKSPAISKVADLEIDLKSLRLN